MIEHYVCLDKNLSNVKSNDRHRFFTIFFSTADWFWVSKSVVTWSLSITCLLWRYMLNKNVGLQRRLLWMTVVILGLRIGFKLMATLRTTWLVDWVNNYLKTLLSYSGHNIISNIRHYYSYPSSLKPGTNETITPDIKRRLNELNLTNVAFLPKVSILSFSKITHYTSLHCTSWYSYNKM